MHCDIVLVCGVVKCVRTLWSVMPGLRPLVGSWCTYTYQRMELFLSVVTVAAN